MLGGVPVGVLYCFKSCSLIHDDKGCIGPPEMRPEMTRASLRVDSPLRAEYRKLNCR